jgi:uncharacterized protein YggT (Ycf19 family)
MKSHFLKIAFMLFAAVCVIGYALYILIALMQWNERREKSFAEAFTPSQKPNEQSNGSDTTVN